MLLAGTIAGSIGEADAMLASVGCDSGDAIHCMRRFLLSNQLTLNLTAHPELPNPSHGELKTFCEVPGASGDLGYWLGQALAIHAADGAGYTREHVLQVKTMLDSFANLYQKVI